MTDDQARKLLHAAGVFFYDDPSELDGEGPEWLQMLNLNDTFGWACADGEFVSDDELPAVADLYRRYGWCGILFWVAEKRGMGPCEFADVNRFVEFVRNEERIRAETPKDSARAYRKVEYVIGGEKA